MNVREMTGALLDSWVAKANGWKRSAELSVWVDEREVVQFSPAACYDPSRDWSLGGPIIEREKIILGARQRMENGRWGHLHWTARAYCPANQFRDYSIESITGDTALVAAMRAFVWSKFGNEVSDAV